MDDTLSIGKQFDIGRKVLDLSPDTIFIYIAGSRAYGTNTESSDLDIRGVYMNSKQELIGLKKDQGTKRSQKDDLVLYSLKNTVRLLLDNNPNIIEMLGLRIDDIIYLHPIFEKILVNKNLFFSADVIHKKFNGFAESEEKRFGRLMKQDDPKLLCKAMMHYIRIYATGEELLRTGKMVTYREKEHDFLMDIRNGKFIDPDAHIIHPEFYTNMACIKADFENAYKNTVLPMEADREGAEKLLMEIFEEFHFLTQRKLPL